MVINAANTFSRCCSQTHVHIYNNIIIIYAARLCVCPSKGCLFDNCVATRSVKKITCLQQQGRV